VPQNCGTFYYCIAKTLKSYIDVAIILDELSASDIRAYNDMLDTLDYRELVYFVSVRFFNYVRPKKLKKEIGHKRLTPNIVYDIIIQKLFIRQLKF